jgi:hypothetical protein
MLQKAAKQSDQTWEPGISDVSRGMLGGYPEIQNSGVGYPAYPW